MLYKFRAMVAGNNEVYEYVCEHDSVLLLAWVLERDDIVKQFVVVDHEPKNFGFSRIFFEKWVDKLDYS